MYHDICDDLEYCEVQRVDDEGNHIRHCHYQSGCCGWESCPPKAHPQHDGPCDCPIDKDFPLL